MLAAWLSGTNEDLLLASACRIQWMIILPLLVDCTGLEDMILGARVDMTAYLCTWEVVVSRRWARMGKGLKGPKENGSYLFH
jgi:hypothetical protein